MKPFILASILALFIAASSFTQNLTISISGIRSRKGDICIGIYNNSRQFNTDHPYRSLVVPKDKIKDGKIAVLIRDLPAGQYAIAFLDDENSNGKMDYRFMLPAEGCGFSNYRHKGIKKPRFDDFDFELTQNNSYIRVEMQYY